MRDRQAGSAATRTPRQHPQIYMLLALPLLLVACGKEPEPAATVTQAIAEPVAGVTAESGAVEESRWYAQSQIDRGGEVFMQNCSVCHGDRAQGLTDNWRQRNADGTFPAPPLDGSAHAWHHPLSQLVQIIETGGQPYGGQMPPFVDVLTADDRLAAIAFFQSFWSAETYADWLDMGGVQ